MTRADFDLLKSKIDTEVATLKKKYESKSDQALEDGEPKESPFVKEVFDALILGRLRL